MNIEKTRVGLPGMRLMLPFLCEWYHLTMYSVLLVCYHESVSNIITVEPLYKDASEMRTSPLIRTL